MPRRKRRLDQALHDRAELLARSHPLGAVAEILKLHASQISQMKARGWKALPEGAPKRPVPGDFQLQAADMTFAELAAHYSVGHCTLQRWFRETRNIRPSWRGDPLRKVPRRGGPSQRKSNEELAAIRVKQWETRRRLYGPSGHSPGAFARHNRRDGNA